MSGFIEAKSKYEVMARAELNIRNVPFNIQTLFNFLFDGQELFGPNSQMVRHV
jgi:hypothetical protein